MRKQIDQMLLYRLVVSSEDGIETRWPQGHGFAENGDFRFDLRNDEFSENSCSGKTIL